MMYKTKHDLIKAYCFYTGSPNPGLLKRIKTWLLNFGLHCVLVYRFGFFSKRIFRKNFLIGLPFIVIYMFLKVCALLIHHVEIESTINIGPGLLLGHSFNILIGADPIGENCFIGHGVTIGEGVANNENGTPQIGDNVWIGPGSIITGDIKIGNGVTISAGTVLSKDIPDNCLVAGNPGRIINQNFDNSVFHPRLTKN